MNFFGRVLFFTFTLVPISCLSAELYQNIHVEGYSAQIYQKSERVLIKADSSDSVSKFGFDDLTQAVVEIREKNFLLTMKSKNMKFKLNDIILCMSPCEVSLQKYKWSSLGAQPTSFDLAASILQSPTFEFSSKVPVQKEIRTGENLKLDLTKRTATHTNGKRELFKY